MVSRVWFWLILPIAICLFPAAGLGQAKSRLSLDIVCDQPSHLFTVGEPATLTVRISNPGPQVAATFRYWIDDAVEGEVKSEQRELTIPAGQTISQSIMIPSDRKGSFRARLDLESADETISQTFPFAITSPPLPSQPLATSRFGISSYLPYYPQRADAKMAVLAQAGARWIRFPFLWGEIEPAQGEFDWAKYDELVGMVAKHGLQILGTLCYCAPWAALDPQTRRLGSDLLSPPKDPTQFASFVARVVERYKGSIHHWEIWNEPNSDWGYGKSRIGEYRELLEAAYRAAKQSDPNCQVLMGGLGGADLDYLKRLCSWEGGNPFDLLNVHTYLAPRPPDLGQLPSSINFGLSLEQTFQELESLAARLHLPRSIWLSEMGWATFSGDRGSSEMEQANHLARAYLIAWAAGFDKVFWHSGFDLMPNRPEEREQDTWDQHTGILRTDFTPKPAYLAYQTVSSQLEGAKFIRQLELPDYLRGLVFQVKNQPIVAIWSVAGQVTLGMNMKMEGKSILMTDLMGNLGIRSPAYV